MPELPEVEITRRHLSDALSGQRFHKVSVGHPRTARHNPGSVGEVESRLTGRLVDSVGRKGKFLVLALDDGQTMVAHLGMSGRFAVDPTESAPHTHFSAEMSNGRRVDFVDPRTFGFVAVFDADDLPASGVGRLGPDAWEDPPDPASLAEALANRTAPIKALLLDQGPISGLGNIYADETLFLASIDPLAPGGTLDESELARLLTASHQVLASAIEHGGTSLDDLAYLLPDGRAGENLRQLQVYGRAGEPCLRCGETIDRVVVRSRSTYFCPGCQVAK